MTIQNRWGDSLGGDDSGSLLGPDGKPLQSPKESVDPQSEPDAMTLDFFNYIASLGFQAMIFLGEMPNPVTNQSEKNLKQAKFLIDTLILLREKTTGNLSKEEAELLNGSIFELERRYVEIARQEGNAS